MNSLKSIGRAPKVVMYTKDPCPYCRNAKQFFESRSIPVQEIDLTHKPDEYAKLKAKTGHMTVPQIYINDQFVGGYTDLRDAYDRGDLKGIVD